MFPYFVIILSNNGSLGKRNCYIFNNFVTSYKNQSDQMVKITKKST